VPSDGELRLLAAQLARAERERVPIAPLTQALPDLAPADAYAIQRLGIARRLGDGATLLGHKIGLTSTAMQEQFGVSEPDYGHLLADMLVAGEVAADRFIQPRVELEPAFVLAARLAGPGVTDRDVAAATDHVRASIEIIDSRIRNWDIRLADTIADNGSSAALVLGERSSALDAVAIAAEPAQMEIDGELVEQGNTAEIMGSPLTAIAWLANALAAYGLALEPGHTVLPGTCMRSAPVARGSRVRGSFPNLGDVEIEFT
jgi:2-keto-4-pentenoate hydratase